MTFENLNSNIAKEKKIIAELNVLSQEYEKSISVEEKNFLKDSSFSLLEQIEILNNSLPSLIQEIPSLQPETEKKEIPERIILAKPLAKPVKPGARIVTEAGILVINEYDKKRFMETLEVEEEALKLVRKKIAGRKEAEAKKITASNQVFRKPSAYIAISNKFFSGLSFKLSKTDFFKKVDKDLKKANMPYLLSNYISVMFFTSLIALFVAIPAAIFIAFLFSKTNLPFAIFRNILISLAAPFVTFFAVYAYPSTEASSISGDIDNELPFAIMHLAAIAGSGIEPSKMFTIIALSNEYPNVRKEARKIINQINLYGYDLTNSLSSVAKATSSAKFADMLNGMATTISTGGNLQSYLEKKAADTMVDYKLARRKYVQLASTYADMYTGLLIAAPLIFMLLLVVIGTMGGTFGGLSTTAIAQLGIAGIIVVNMLFLVFLSVSTKAES